MKKISANIKKFVGISLILLGTLPILSACGSKESKKSEQSSSSSSIKNNESIQSSSSSSSTSSSSSNSSSSSQEGFGNSSQILSGNYSSLNGTWQTADGTSKIILKNGNIIFSSEYVRNIKSNS
ncbi:DUF6287 domain-containing protein [Lactococcus cremoris]